MFKKIRIKATGPRPINKSICHLIDKRNDLIKNKTSNEEIEKLDFIMRVITETNS